MEKNREKRETERERDGGRDRDREFLCQIETEKWRSYSRTETAAVV